MKSKFNKFIIKFFFFLKKEKYIQIKSGLNKGLKWNVLAGGGYTKYILGTYESKLIKEWIAYLNQDDIFFDIGANCGFMSLLGARKSKHVISFEPHPRNLYFLKGHVRENGLNNKITIVEKAVAKENGFVEFSDSDNLAGNSYIKGSVQHNATSKRIQVPSISVDSFVQSEKIIPNFLKIDVEGAEHDVLLGAEQTIEHYKPKIYLSTHENHKTGVEKECLDFLQAKGYTITQLDINSNQQWNGIKDWLCIKH